MEKLINTPFGDMAITLNYDYRTVYGEKDPESLIKDTLKRIDESNQFNFFAARLAEEGETAFPVGHLLRQRQDNADSFTIHGVGYKELDGSFKIRPNEHTGEPEIYQLCFKAQRTDGSFSSYGALTPKAHDYLYNALPPLLLPYVLRHQGAMREEERAEFFTRCRASMKEIQTLAKRWETAISEME